MKEVTRKTIRGLLALFRAKGYKIYDKPFELNIVGVRNPSTVPNRFDDVIYVFWKDDKGNWVGKHYTATTDTGTFWLKSPMNPKGSALLKEGQYVNGYKIGLHQGKYKALVQQRPVTVVRDYNRDNVLDFNNGKEETGFFGINIHRANKEGKTKTVDRNSAGCQVFEDADEYNNFMDLVEKHRSLYGNNFTYTLIDERALKRTIARRFVYFVLAGGIIGLGYYLLKTREK